MQETMYTYINEQHYVLNRMMTMRTETASAFKSVLNQQDIKKIIFVASGTSYNAAMSAKYFMEQVLGIEIDVKYPYSFAHYDHIFEKHSLVIGISQGGKSTATIDALHKARDNGFITIAMTAYENSEITKAADHTILIPCGDEKVVFRTLGYTSTLLTLYVMCLEASVSTKRINQNVYQRYNDELFGIIRNLPIIIDSSEQWYSLNKRELMNANKIIVVGYGPNYGTALEGALKLNETVRCPASAYELEEFMHGPHLELDHNSFIFLISSQGIGKYRIGKLHDFVETVTPYSYMIADQEEVRTGNCLSISSISNEMISPLEFVIPFQMISYQLAMDKGIRLDIPKYPDFNKRLQTKNG
jgi:glucoselysine-6-phosphate deglycase